MKPEASKHREGPPEDAGFLEKSIWEMGGFGENIANNALPALANATCMIASPLTRTEHELELRQIERLADWRVDGAIPSPTPKKNPLAFLEF